LIDLPSVERRLNQLTEIKLFVARLVATAMHVSPIIFLGAPQGAKEKKLGILDGSSSFAQELR